MTSSLFSHSGASEPLAARMRPRSLAEVLGQDHLLAPGSPLRTLIEKPSVANSSIILWGPPGTGKTSLANLVASETSAGFQQISAISAGVKEIREAIEQAAINRDCHGKRSVLFIDEVHRFSKSQQDALLPAVEDGTILLIAATTENPSFSVIAPLISRSLVFAVRSLTDSDIHDLVNRALKSRVGLDDKYELEPLAINAITKLSGGDARRALTILEACASVAAGNSRNIITVEDVSESVATNVVRYDQNGTEHYDVISAFIKSVRGSDVDAALHYLARMIEAGEDPRFIARRLMILASEDIGLADNAMLPLATATAQSVNLVGMPEARLMLAHATIALSLSPKSNSVYNAISKALDDVRAGSIGKVPAPLRDSALSQKSDGSQSNQYIYPHDLPEGIANQQYLPNELTDREYYIPSNRGGEHGLSNLLAKLRSLLGRK